MISVMVTASKMTSHCAGTVQMTERRVTQNAGSEKRFKKIAEDGEGAAVTCDGRLFHSGAAATGNALSS